MSFERTRFREAMARFGAAVNIVTSAGPAGRCGYTCTAACSVTDDPAMVLVCLNRSSAMNPVIRENGVFCLNVLGGSQQHLSAQFAGQTRTLMADRFGLSRWSVLETGSPVLDDAVCAIDCRIVDVREYGTHSIFVGEVLDLRISDGGDTLIYCNRNYHSVPSSAERKA